MTEKIAYFVLGSEGSGTYCLRNALVEAGCSWKSEHDSFRDNYKFEEMKSPLVFRRSLPHAHIWPNIINIVEAMERADFEVHILFIIRDFNASAKSVMSRDKQKDEEDCYYNQKEALVSIGTFLRHRHEELTYITYESFCLSEGFRKWLFDDRLGLPYPENFEIKYANDKYYK